MRAIDPFEIYCHPLMKYLLGDGLFLLDLHDGTPWSSAPTILQFCRCFLLLPPSPQWLQQLLSITHRAGPAGSQWTVAMRMSPQWRYHRLDFTCFGPYCHINYYQCTFRAQWRYFNIFQHIKTAGGGSSRSLSQPGILQSARNSGAPSNFCTYLFYCSLICCYI